MIKHSALSELGHIIRELWATCVSSVALPLSTVGIFSTFPAAARVSPAVTATQLELANEIANGGGTDSKHARCTSHLCRELEEI